MGIVGALIGSAIVSALGGVISGAISSNAQKQANDTNVELANTAHQREVADLKAAGLNPWMSASGSGAGGSVAPVTGSAQAVSSATGDISHILSSLVNLKMMETMSSARNATNLERANITANSYRDRTVQWKRSNANSARSVDSSSSFDSLSDKEFKELLRIAKTPWIKK